MISKRYNGVRYKSIRALSTAVGVPYRQLSALLRKGYSTEEAVEQLETRKQRYEWNGKFYATQKEIADELGISVRVLLQNPRYQEIQKQIVTTKKPFVFNGVKYESKEAFYRELGISGSGIRKYAVRHGISTKKALRQIAKERLRNPKK